VLASPDTVLGAFIRDLEARIAEEEASAAAHHGDTGDTEANEDTGDTGNADHADDGSGAGEAPALDTPAATATTALADDTGAKVGAGRKGRAAIPVAGDGPADELRDALRLGRLLLSGVEVTL
jgi:hypothetical protein